MRRAFRATGTTGMSTRICTGLNASLRSATAALLVATLGLWASPAALAQAQAFPTRAVTLIVPYAAGGGTDAVARTLARDLSAQWGQPVIVENRAGADGWVGTQRMLSQPADGYTLLVQLNSMLLWKWVLPEAKLDLTADLLPITRLQHSPMVALVRGNVPASSLREMFESCRKAAKPCNLGTSTLSAQFMARQMSDLGDMPGAAIVPYKGTAPMITDLLGGHVDIALVSGTLAVPLAADGRAKALAVGTPSRFAKLPQSPTFSEAGYALKGGTTWYGLFARRGTPEPVVAAIAAAVRRAGSRPEVIASIDAQGGVPVFNSAEAFSREMVEELQGLETLAQKYLK